MIFFSSNAGIMSHKASSPRAQRRRAHDQRLTQARSPSVTQAVHSMRRSERPPLQGDAEQGIDRGADHSGGVGVLAAAGQRVGGPRVDCGEGVGGVQVIGEVGA